MGMFCNYLLRRSVFYGSCAQPSGAFIVTLTRDIKELGPAVKPIPTDCTKAQPLPPTYHLLHQCQVTRRNYLLRHTHSPFIASVPSHEASIYYVSA